MVQHYKKSIFCVLICLAFLLSVFGGMSFAQEKEVDIEKLYAEIAGAYVLRIEGKYWVYIFSVEDGNLMGSPQDWGAEADVLQPVEDTAMTFIRVSKGGAEYKFKFVRDDDGKITKFTLYIPSQDIEADAERIIV